MSRLVFVALVASLAALAAPAAAQQTPFPPSTPIGPTRCGTFGALALDAAVPLLDDRLRIRPLHGMRDEARGHSIMAADVVSADETRLVLESHGQKLVVFAFELNATMPADLVPAARTTLAAFLSQPESVLLQVFVDAPGTTVAAFVPGPPAPEADAVPVLAAIVVPADRHPLALAFFVTPGIRAPGCTQLARQIAATVTSGPRALSAPAREVDLSGLAHAHVPADWTYTMQPGPDFDVHYFHRLDPLGSTIPTEVGVYVGGSPQQPAAPTRTVAGRVLGQRIQWGYGAHGAEVIVRFPGRIQVAHVWANGGDAAAIDAGRALAATFTLLPAPAASP